MKLYQEMFPKATRSDKGQAHGTCNPGEIDPLTGKRVYNRVKPLEERATQKPRCDMGVARTEENQREL